MEIDINFELVYYTCNINPTGFYWRTYGNAIWYDTRIETRKEARKRLKDQVWEDILDDNPHLVGTEIKYLESGEMPIIYENER